MGARRVAHGPPELALHRRALRRDRLDVAGPDLREEGRVVRNANALLPTAGQQRHDEQLEGDEHEDPPEVAPAETGLGARRPRRDPAPVRARADPPALGMAMVVRVVVRRPARPPVARGSVAGRLGSIALLAHHRSDKRSERASATPALRRAENY
jgi:hypothetical protein